MRLVIITKRYDSSVINQKVQPTPLDAEGNPKYAIYLSDERAQVLIDAGVAEEYVTEDLIVDDSNDGVSDSDTNEGSATTDSNPDDSNADDNVDGDANNEDPNADDSNDDESQEQTTDTKSKSNSKKNKSSK